MSKKKDIAKQSLRRLKITGVALLIVFGPLLLLYSWLALRPTGYGELVGEIEAAELAIGRRFEAAWPAGHDRLTSSSLMVGEERQRSNLGGQLEADWDGPGFDLEFWMEAMPGSWFRWYAWSQNTMGGLQFPDKSPESAPQIGPADQEQLLMHIRHWGDWGRMLRPLGQRSEFNNESRIKLMEGIEKAERLILAPRAPMSGTVGDARNYSWRRFQQPGRLIQLGILLAAVSGDSTKAEVLLHAQLAAIQELRLASYPFGPEGVKSEPFISTIMWAARIPEISDQALARVDAQLAGFVLSPEERKQFQVDYARRATEVYAARVEKDQVASGIDEFNYFFEGGPERGWRRAMNPLLKNNLERLTVAWAGNDLNAWEAAEREHRRLLPWLNVKPPGALGLFYKNGDYIAGNWGNGYHIGERDSRLRLARGGFDEDIIVARLVLAAERYRRKRGEYPKSLDALSGDYPYIWELSTPEFQCSILWLDEIRIPTLPKAQDGEEDPYFNIRKALDRFRMKNNTNPASAEELAPELDNEEDLKLASEIFVSYPGRPVFCFTWRRDYMGGPGIPGYLSVNALFPVNPEIPDWMRQAVMGKSNE